MTTSSSQRKCSVRTRRELLPCAPWNPSGCAAGSPLRLDCGRQVEMQVLQVPDDEQLERHDGGPGHERDEQAHSEAPPLPLLAAQEGGHEDPGDQKRDDDDDDRRVRVLPEPEWQPTAAAASRAERPAT